MSLLTIIHPEVSLEIQKSEKDFLSQHGGLRSPGGPCLYPCFHRVNINILVGGEGGGAYDQGDLEGGRNLLQHKIEVSDQSKKLSVPNSTSNSGQKK